MADTNIKYSTAQRDRLLKQIFDGKVNVEKLPKGLYVAISNNFKKSLERGYGKKISSIDPESKEGEVISNMVDNLYNFSAAKTFQVVNELQDLAAKMNQSYESYEEQARGIFTLYNETYQKTEFNTAEAIATSADKWREIEENKETLPYLRWNAVVDEVTDDECLKLDGLTLHVDDELWETANPPLHYNCRCILEQVDIDESGLSGDEDKDKARELLDDHADELFDFNAWKEEIIFPESHPYFDVAKQFEELKDNNFGLPIPNN